MSQMVRGIRGGSSGWGRTALRIVVVVALYVLGARLGLALASENRNVTLVWPPTGLAVVCLVLWGYRVLPGVVIGAFVANVVNGASLETAAAITVGNSLAPLAAAVGLVRARFHHSLDRVADLLLLIVVGAVAMTISASAGTASLAVTGSLGTSSVASVWLLWWLGDTFGIVLMAPFLFLLAGVDRTDPIARRPYEAIALVLVAGTVAFAVFTLGLPLAFLISVPIVWAALRFERFTTSFIVVLVAVITITRTASGYGEFATSSPTEDLMSLQIFNAALGFFSMVLAIVMSQRTRAERALQITGDRYRRVFEQASDIVFIHDSNGLLTYANAAASQITGYTNERLLTMHVTDLVAPGSVQVVKRAVGRQVAGETDATTYEVQMPTADGRAMSVELNSSAIHTDDEPAFQVIGRDVTTRRLAEEQLREGSLEDQLTGLANIASLRERLDYAVALAARDGTRVVLAIAGVDRFRRINASIGRDAGDEVLVKVATQLQQSFRQPETVARLRGDGFAVLVPTPTGGRSPEVVAEQMLAASRVSLGARIEQETTTTSVGVAVFPEHARDAGQLIRHAEIAMVDAKRLGGDRSVVYHAGLDDRVGRGETLTDELFRAVADGNLTVHYQPVVEAATLRTLRAECLLRWPHPRLGIVPPSEFIPLAIANGLMDAITVHVMSEAVERCFSWTEADLGVGVSINLSGAELRPETASLISKQLEAAGHVPASSITVEVSEQDVRMASSHTALEQLSSLGVRLSVDRFGADASSLAHLSHLTIAEMKIDRSIVVNVSSDPKVRAVAKAIIELAHSLGAIAVAVGVETRESWSVLHELGCDAMQGFMISKPLPRTEFEAWLRTPAWSGRVR